jgi:hypothetical protein
VKRSAVIGTLALLVGIAIGYVDSRTTWDDAGVTAGALFIAALILSVPRPRAAWLVSLAVGLPVVAFNIVLHGGFGSVVALAFSGVGAAAGFAIGRALGGDDARRAAR